MESRTEWAEAQLAEMKRKEMPQFPVHHQLHRRRHLILYLLLLRIIRRHYRSFLFSVKPNCTWFASQLHNS